jgi:hypothetical protein
MAGSNPCTDKLTDIEYLEHTIPHHPVAIDMSNLLIPIEMIANIVLIIGTCCGFFFRVFRIVYKTKSAGGLSSQTKVVDR